MSLPPAGPGDSGRVSPLLPDSHGNHGKKLSPDVQRQIPKSVHGPDQSGPSVMQRRVGEVQPQPQLNPTVQLTEQFQQQAALAVVESTKVEFLDSIPDLKKLLTDPSFKLDSFPFDILYINESGKPVSVLAGLNGHPDAEAIKKSLLGKLENIQKGNTEESVQALRAGKEAALQNFVRVRNEFSKLSLPLPRINLPPIQLFIDDAIFAAKPMKQSEPPKPQTKGKIEPHFVLTPKKPTLSMNEPASLPPISFQPRPPTAPIKKLVTSGKAAPIELTITEIPAEKDKIHASIFPTNEEVKVGKIQGSVASVNAGTSDLSIGGAGINAAFKNKVSRNDEYKALHNKLMEFAKTKTEPVVELSEEALDGTPLQAMYAFFPRIQGKKYTGDGMGAVFVDVFKDTPPNGCEANKAMVYVYPPEGKAYNTKEEFLAAVTKTAFDIPSTVNNYNHLAVKRGHLPKLETLRMSAISSGLYRHKDCDPAEVEEAVRKGILLYQTSAADQNLIKEIQLPPQLHNRAAS